MLKRRIEALEAEIASLLAERLRLRRKLEWTEVELGKVQAHLTTILSSRFFRFTRLVRRRWRRVDS